MKRKKIKEKGKAYLAAGRLLLLLLLSSKAIYAALEKREGRLLIYFAVMRDRPGLVRRIFTLVLENPLGFLFHPSYEQTCVVNKLMRYSRA